MANENYKSNIPEFIKQHEKAVEKALLSVGVFTQGVAKHLCPVVTGRLRGSIGYKVDKKEQAMHLGTNVEYALAVEKGLGRRYAKPYLTPAVENNKKQIQSLVTNSLKM